MFSVAGSSWLLWPCSQAFTISTLSSHAVFKYGGGRSGRPGHVQGCQVDRSWHTGAVPVKDQSPFLWCSSKCWRPECLEGSINTACCLWVWRWVNVKHDTIYLTSPPMLRSPPGLPPPYLYPASTQTQWSGNEATVAGLTGQSLHRSVTIWVAQSTMV